MSVRFHLNGEPRETAEPRTLAELIEELGLRPEHVAVERNRVLVPRGERATARVEDGDRIELVTLVGGG